MGFTPPFGRWLKAPRYSTVLKEMLLDDGLAKLVDMKSFETRLREHISGFRNHESVLFVLLSLFLWRKIFVEKTLQPDTPLSHITSTHTWI